MSASAPMNTGEKEAKIWAEEQDTTPIEMVERIQEMQQLVLSMQPDIEEARKNLDGKLNAQRLMTNRVDALRHRLMKEL